MRVLLGAQLPSKKPLKNSPKTAARTEPRAPTTRDHRVAETVGNLPGILESKGDMGKELLTQYRDSIQATSALLDKVGPLMTTVQGVAQESGTAVGRVNESLRIVQAMQAEAAKASGGAPSQPVDLQEYGALLENLHKNLVAANALLGTTQDLTDKKQLAERLQPIENLIQMRIREVQGATDAVVGGLIGRLAMLVGGVLAALFLFHLWRRKQKA
jgi:hypothetical protein